MSSPTDASPTTSASNHEPKVIAVKDVNDENIAYLVRCCDDPKTDSWVTVSVHLADTNHDDTIKVHKDRVSTNHTNKLSRLKKAQALI